MSEFKDSDETARRLLEALPDAVMLVNEQTCISIANSQCERVFGYSRSELTGVPFAALIPVELHAEYAERMAAHVANPSVRPQEARIELSGRRKDGGQFPIEVALSAAQIADRTLALIIVRDITLRKEADEEHRRSREDLETALHGIGDGVIVVDLRGCVVRINPAAESLTGWSAADAFGKRFDEVCSLIDAETRVPIDSPVLALRHAVVDSRPNKLLLVSRAGAEHPIASSSSLMRDVQGELRGAVLVLRDRSAEAAQQAAQARLDALFQCAPAYISIIDIQGRFEYMNRVMAHHKYADVIGSNWLRYMPARYHERMTAALQAVIRNGESRILERVLQGPDDTEILLSSHLGPMQIGDRIIGAVMVSLDVTSLKRAQAESASAQRLAAVGTLAAGVAHEINTPVQFVTDSVTFLRDAMQDLLILMDSAQHLREVAAAAQASVPQLSEAVTAAADAEDEADLPYLRENVPKAFERILDGLERVATIVRSMKEFAHPAQKSMAPVDLNRSIQNTLTISRNEYRYVAEVETDFGAIPPVTCFVNDINQVILNLVVNAGHAIADVVEGTSNKGLIKVHTEQQGDSVVITISDTGRGIPDDVLPHIFEPFFTTKQVGKGTGQGLSVVWAIVQEKHRGEIKVTTEVGKGTTFSVRLPIAGNQSDSE